MWKQFKNFIVDRRVLKNYSDIEASIFISNSDQLINEDQSLTISRYSYVKQRAEHSIHPILIIGRCKPIPNSFTVLEYTAMYPQLLGLYHKESPMQQSQAAQQLHDKGVQPNKGDPHQISGIYIIGLDIYWDIQAQVVSDLISTENGLINNKFERVKSHIPLQYFYNTPDKEMERQQIAIESTYKLLYGQDIVKSEIISDLDIVIDRSISNNQELVFISKDNKYKVKGKQFEIIE